ncbi:MAG: cystatin family protein [Prosthecobacter sp.]|nr:cystatin family protein [Prosthecobacter sp.]
MMRIIAGSAACVWLLAACPAKESDPPMPGGFSKGEVGSPDVIKAAEFAIQAKQAELAKEKGTAASQLKLVSILAVQQQVVAGMNYAMTLKVMLDGQEQQVTATVWVQAWNEETPYQLTSWVVKE